METAIKVFAFIGFLMTISFVLILLTWFVTRGDRSVDDHYKEFED